MLRLSALLVLVAAGSLVAADTPAPIWRPAFSVAFNETTRLLTTRHTSGLWLYDAENNRELIHRQDGIGDRYCGSIHFWQSMPCTHLVLAGKRYLLFPQLRSCCLCCNASQGCGILSPAWLEGAAFEGTVDTQQGVRAYKWRQDGLQPNYYYATADAQQLPVQLDQVPNDFQTFDVQSFRPGPLPDEAFDLPRYCTPEQRCPRLSACGLLQQPGAAGATAGGAAS